MASTAVLARAYEWSAKDKGTDSSHRQRPLNRVRVLRACESCEALK